LFAWWRLIKLYEQNNQPKAILVCVAEILDRAEEDGITTWGRFPPWLEQVMMNMICQNGYKSVMKLAKDVDVLDQKHLMKMLKRIVEEIKCEGYDK
jgi:hypothetical protein